MTIDVGQVPAATAPAPEQQPRGGARRRVWQAVFTLQIAIVLVSFYLILFTEISPEGQGLAVIVSMLILLAMGMHAGAAMTVPSVIGMYGLVGYDASATVVMTMPVSFVSSWSLSVIPMFVLMGLILGRSGVTAKLYKALRGVIHWLPGGLAVTSGVAGAGMGAVSGSTTGITYAVGRIAIPEMLRAGYSPRLATGAVLTTGTVGQLIPPSILLVIYAGAVGVPVGQQLMAGLLPGLLLALLYVCNIVVRSTRSPDLAPRTAKPTTPLRGRLVALGTAALPIAMLFGAVVGGLFQGVFTATEAGAFGVLGAAIILVIESGKQSGKRLVEALVATVSAVGSIFFMLIGAYILSRVITLSQLPVAAAEWVGSMGLSRVALLIALIVLYLILGMFLDTLAIILVTVPVILPIVTDAGVTPIWFGVFIVILAELAAVTPPVGMLSYVVHRLCQAPEVNLGQRISLWTVFRGGLMFIPITLVMMAIMIQWPELVEWLPNRSGE